MRIALVFASLAFVVNGCSCGSAARACASTDDCRAGEVCLAGADGASTCQLAPAAEGEGEGATSEGEGAASEGEGAAGEGEGEGGEGEGAVCGDGVVIAPEQCDDGNGDDKDACSNACTATTATASVVFGVTPVRSLSLAFVADVSGSSARGFVIADGLGALFFEPPNTGGFARVDANRPLQRGTFAGTTPNVAAVAPDGTIVYADETSGLVHRLDPASGNDVVIAGNGHKTDVPTDPPGFVFSGGALSVQLAGTQAIDVDDNGTVYLACDKRVIAIDADGTTRVVAGAEATETQGTAAQKQRFNQLSDVSVQHDAAGAPIGLWVAGVTSSNAADPLRVDLASGAVAFFHGAGVACDAQPLAGCQVAATSVLDDGHGGFFAIGTTNLVVGSGILHVDANDPATATVTTFASIGTLPSLPSHAAQIEPGVIAVNEIFDAELRLVHDAASGGGVEDVGFIAPQRATDRTLFPIFASTTSATRAYVATLTDLFSVDESGVLAHIAAGTDLGPCAQRAFPISAMAATNDDVTLYFVEGGEASSTICALDLATKSVTVLASSSSTLPSLGAIALRSSDLLVATSAGVKSVALSNGAVSASAIIANPPHAVVEIASSTAGTAEVLFADGSRASIGAPPTNSVGNIAASSLGAVAGLVAPNDAEAIVFDPQKRVIVDVNGANGISAPLAGSSGAPAGFKDGAAAQALFGAAGVARLRKIGASGPIVVDDASSLRFLSAGTVTTVLGSDQFEEDGDFATARLTHPSSLACFAHQCIAADASALNLRVVDFDTSRTERVLGSEGSPLTGLVDVTLLDATHAVWTDGSILHEVDLTTGADTVFLQGTFVGNPTLVTSIGGGQVAFFDGTAVKTAPGLLTLASSLSSAPAAFAFDSARDLVVVVTQAPATLHFVAVAAGAIVPADLDVDAALGAAHGVAVDDASNIYLSTDDAIAAVGPSETSPRTLLSAGDPLFPFAGTMRALAVEDGDLVAADAWTGALVRVHVQ